VVFNTRSLSPALAVICGASRHNLVTEGHHRAGCITHTLTFASSGVCDEPTSDARSAARWVFAKSPVAASAPNFMRCCHDSSPLCDENTRNTSPIIPLYIRSFSVYCCRATCGTDIFIASNYQFGFARLYHHSVPEPANLWDKLYNYLHFVSLPSLLAPTCGLPLTRRLRQWSDTSGTITQTPSSKVASQTHRDTPTWIGFICC
jgi:hypothetical protein